MSVRSVRVARVLCVVFGLFSVVPAAAVAAPADVDRSFGREGVATLDATAVQYATPNDVAVGPDREIYVLRTARRCPAGAPCTNERLVDRLRPGGRSGGGVFLPIEGDLEGDDSSIAVGSDGKPVVAAATPDGDLALARLNPDGSRDSGFGAAGIARFDLGVPVDRASVAVGSDGRVVVAAEPRSGYGGDAVFVARFTAQGAPDPSFNGGAPFVTTLGSGFGGFGVTRAGGVAIAGPRCCGSVGNAVHVSALDPAGRPSSVFGRNGQVFVDDVSRGAGVGAVVVLPNGAIYVVGLGLRRGDAFVLRLKPNGRLNRRYGRRGVVYMKRSRLRAVDAMVDRAGRLLVVGISPARSKHRVRARSLTLARLLANGRRDRTFGGGSLVHLASLGPISVVGAGLQDGRRIVVLGRVGSCSRICAAPRSLLVRFIGGSSRARCFGHRATIVGTRHGERLVGTRHRDVIAALAGNDLVLGRGGNDLICGGRGNDRLLGGGGRDRIGGGPGRNRIGR